jgi:hypothetical protein
MGAKNQASLICILISIIVLLLFINGCTPEQEQQLKEKYKPEVKEVVKEAVQEALQNNTQTDNIICNRPYIRVGNNCCLDANNNSICDVDETTENSQLSYMSDSEKDQYLLNIYNDCASKCYYDLTPEERGQDPTPCQAKCKTYKDEWEAFHANVTKTVYPIVEAPKETGPPPDAFSLNESAEARPTPRNLWSECENIFENNDTTSGVIGHRCREKIGDGNWSDWNITWINEPPQDNPTNAQSCPSNCEDNNKCTTDYCSSGTNFACRHDPIELCCGNQKCDGSETFLSCPNDCTPLYPDLEVSEIQIYPANPSNDELVYITVIVSNHGKATSGTISVLVDDECIRNVMDEFKKPGGYSTIRGVPCPFNNFDVLQPGESRELFFVNNQNKYVPNFVNNAPFWYTGEKIGQHQIKISIETSETEYNLSNNEKTLNFDVENQGRKKLIPKMEVRALQGSFSQNSVIEIGVSLEDNFGYPITINSGNGISIFMSNDDPNSSFKYLAPTFEKMSSGKALFISPVLVDKGNYTISLSTGNAVMQTTAEANYSFEII